MKKFVTSDTHGSYLGLLEALEKANFNKEEDLLIHCGDVVDSWSQTKQCIDYLLSIKNLVYLPGNHCEWAYLYFIGKLKQSEAVHWFRHGGLATLKSYGLNENTPRKEVSEVMNTTYKAHLDLIGSTKLFHIEDDNIFVHGDIDEHIVKNNETGSRAQNICRWGREMITNPSLFSKIDGKRVWVGHTTTEYLLNQFIPIIFNHIIAIDTSAAFNGPVTVMNIETLEYFQSRPSKELYPTEKGRNKKSLI